MSSARQGGGSRQRFGSTAWAVSWSFWWRKLLDFLFFDVALVAVVVAALLLSYNRTLVGTALSDSLRPKPGVTARVDVPGMLGPHSVDLRTAVYVVVDGKTEHSFPLGADTWAMWPAGLAILAAQGVNLLGIIGDTRRVRRKLQPLNELALRAESLGAADLTSFDKIESLEQAIERASVDSPEVTTGDSDLASIEIALNRLLRQMQEAKLQQMRFVNDASHELRTPIAVIQGYVGMLDRWGKTDPAVLDESIEALKNESEHMQELVEQLLFLARGDSGRNAVNKVPVSLGQLACEVWEESAMIDPDHRYQLAKTESAANDPALTVTGDVAMLKQSMRIICQNAAKYSPAGSTITFDFGPNTTSKGGAFFSIADEGIGMSSEAAGHMFERFYRADNARNAGVDGSGLGLSIAKWIVDTHGGTIDVLSREGVGTRVTVTIPAA